MPETKITSSGARTNLLRQVLPPIRTNCSISDATQSGFYSLCGLFLRLKDKFNWEQNTPPWNPTDKDRLLKWIDQKEAQWLDFLDSPFVPIMIANQIYDCLDSRGINHHLIPAGLYYGAGYGRGLKPTFFLGEIREDRLVQGYRVIILDHELACDLFLTPAQRQGKTIVIRLEPLRFFLWSKIQETEQREREATAMALSYYGWDLSLPPDSQLEPIIDAEWESILFHELGEALDRSFPNALWKKLLSAFPASRIELYLRTLKDLLADTHPQGTLDHIIRYQKTGSLAFYLSNVKGLRESLFPEILPVVRTFRTDQDWLAIERTRKKVRQRLIHQAHRIRDLAEKWIPAQPGEFSRRFEEAFFKPLGL